MNFSEKLKLVLDLLKVRQIDLSRRTGFSKGAISQFISGRSNPNLESFAAIVNTLNVPAEMLLPDLMGESKRDADVQTIISKPD